MSDKTESLIQSPTRALIEGSAKALGAMIPVAGGAIVQAWSDYSNHKQNERIQGFFDALAKSIGQLKEQQEKLKQNVEAMPDAAEIMERAVEAAAREVSDLKRPMYSRAYINFLNAPGDTAPGERVNIIQDIEQLTEEDLNVLALFRKGKAVRGDMLTNTVDPGFGPMGRAQPPGAWLNEHSPLVNSIQRLLGRGLIVKAQFNAFFSTPGGEDPEFTQFRQSAWRATPLAMKLIKAIS